MSQRESKSVVIGKLRKVVVQLVSIAVLSASFAQFSFAGTIDTSYLLEADNHSASLDRIQRMLAEADVGNQLEKLGVDKAVIDARLEGMTAGELAELEGRLEQEVAGGDALALIGAVFLVLLILELVGVTDIFKSI